MDRSSLLRKCQLYVFISWIYHGKKLIVVNLKLVPSVAMPVGQNLAIVFIQLESCHAQDPLELATADHTLAIFVHICKKVADPYPLGLDPGSDLLMQSGKAHLPSLWQN